MLTNTVLPNTFCAEAMHHGNWLPNHLPSKSIGNGILIRKWRSNVNITDFSSLPTFGQPDFAFVYRSSTSANKKLLARAIHHDFFSSMESYERFFRTYNPIAQSVYVVRLVYFKSCGRDQLPSIATLLDRLSRQAEEEYWSGTANHAEEGLHQAFSVSFTPSVATQNLKDLRLRHSFNDSVQHKYRRDAIDREYQVLRRRKTWTYVKQTPDMNVLPIPLQIKPLYHLM